MKSLYFGSDHGGYGIKSRVIEYFKISKYEEVIDKGCFSYELCDYPDFAESVCKEILKDSNSVGILFCSTGIGISIAANKISGIRCALCNDVKSAYLARKHNDANVIAIGGRVVDFIESTHIINKFLNTDFEGGRHVSRIKKIHDLESKK